MNLFKDIRAVCVEMRITALFLPYRYDKTCRRRYFVFMIYYPYKIKLSEGKYYEKQNSI